jgi:hypothetical protein
MDTVTGRVEPSVAATNAPDELMVMSWRTACGKMRCVSPVFSTMQPKAWSLAGCVRSGVPRADETWRCQPRRATLLPSSGALEGKAHTTSFPEMLLIPGSWNDNVSRRSPIIVGSVQLF